MTKKHPDSPPTPGPRASAKTKLAYILALNAAKVRRYRAKLKAKKEQAAT